MAEQGISTRARSITLVFAFGALALVLFAAFLRVSDSVGVGAPAEKTQTTAPDTTAAPGNGASITASLPPDLTASTTIPGATPQQPTTSTTPSAPVSSAPGKEYANPEQWPSSLPDLGEHKLIEFDNGEEKRWLVAVPGGVQLAGGKVIAGLERNKWTVKTVSTPASVTTVGDMGPSRLSATFRPGASALPAGWSLLEVIYLERVPDFEVPPTTSPDDEEALRKRS